MARKINFHKDGYFHIFNRGVEKRSIILDMEDLYYFLDSLLISNATDYINRSLPRKKKKELASRSANLVEIVAYAVLPNHYHLLLKEISEGGISKFMQKFATGYTMYFNEKYDRSGVLFQGRFKATEVKDLVAVSSYVNLNHIHHQIDPKQSIVRTSWFEYVDPNSVKEPICNQKEIAEIIESCEGVSGYKEMSQSWPELFVENHKKDKDFEL